MSDEKPSPFTNPKVASPCTASVEMGLQPPPPPGADLPVDSNTTAQCLLRWPTLGASGAVTFRGINAGTRGRGKGPDGSSGSDLRHFPPALHRRMSLMGAA